MEGRFWGVVGGADGTLGSRGGGLYRWMGEKVPIFIKKKIKMQERRKAWRSTWLPTHCLSCSLGPPFHLLLLPEEMEDGEGEEDLEGEAERVTQCIKWETVELNQRSSFCFEMQFFDLLINIHFTLHHIQRNLGSFSLFCFYFSSRKYIFETEPVTSHGLKAAPRITLRTQKKAPFITAVQ